MQRKRTNLPIVGGGPTAFYLMHNVVVSDVGPIRVTVVERPDYLGRGMPEGRCFVGLAV
jgi:uncharacterized NAD(P)/FAD-binding protein YdhS